MIRLLAFIKNSSRRCGPAFLAGALISLSTLHVFAYDSDDSDDNGSTNRIKRPIEELFKTDLVYPQDKGEWEVELASVYQNNSEGDTWTAPLSLEYGLSDRWQVEAEWDSYVQHAQENGSWAHGFGDLEIGTQYSFMNLGGTGFHISPLFSIEIPLGSVNKDLSEGFMEYQPAVILAKDIPQLHRTQIFAEIGASLVQRVKKPANEDDVEPAADELNLGTGFFTPFSHGAVSLEFNCDNSRWNNHGTENQLTLTPGAIWKLPHGVELGLGIPVGLNRQSDRYDVIAHMVIEF